MATAVDVKAFFEEKDTSKFMKEWAALSEELKSYFKDAVQEQIDLGRWSRQA